MYEPIYPTVSVPIESLGEGKRTAKEVRAQERDRLAARYESAQTTHDNEPLWRYTDYLSAKAANSFQVRRTLKIRSRYEADNNSYFRGIINTLANDLIGSGPRLQCRLADGNANRIIQTRWHNWARAIRLANKLRTMVKAKVQDGEGFGLLVNNQNLKHTVGGDLDVADAVQLDVAVIESDQVTTPDPGFLDFFWVDGMVLDHLGNPTEYHVLRHHPGDLFVPQLNPLIYDKWRPDHVLHWYRQDRPGQVRGIPEVTPALEAFAKLRRYLKAVLDAAETAADIAAFVETQMPANTNSSEPEPFDKLHFKRGMLMTLPWGAKIGQLHAEQPATTLDMFIKVLLREIARCLDIPLNIAMGDSSDYNFASGRLDHLPYHRRWRIDRQTGDEVVLDKIFAAFMEEALLIDGYLPSGLPPYIPHRWFWDTAESINPIDDANAEKIRLSTGTETYTGIYAERGEDFETAMMQRGKEVEICQRIAKRLDVPLELILPSAKLQQPATPIEEEKEQQREERKKEKKKETKARAGRASVKKHTKRLVHA